MRRVLIQKAIEGLLLSGLSSAVEDGVEVEGLPGCFPVYRKDDILDCVTMDPLQPYNSES